MDAERHQAGAVRCAGGRVYSCGDRPAAPTLAEPERRAFAIDLTARGLAGGPIRQLWDAFGAFETTPSIAHGHPPNLTLAISDRIADAWFDAQKHSPQFR
jgi:hypothetical protein